MGPTPIVRGNIDLIMTVSNGKDLALGNGNQKTYWHWLEELSLVTPFSSVLGLDYCHCEIPTTLLLDWHSTIHIYIFIDMPFHSQEQSRLVGTDMNMQWQAL